MAGMAPPPDMESCSPETQEIGYELYNRFVSGVLYSIDLGNIETFLGMVADWIATTKEREDEKVEDTDLPVPSVYKFNKSDDSLCQANFRETERWYADSYESYASDKEEIMAIYDGLLVKLQEYKVELVDNEEFIYWASTSSNQSLEWPVYLGVPNELEDWTKEKILTESGALPITTVNELADVLGVMFWHRVSSDLEIAAISDMMMMPDIFSCSQETQQAGLDIQSAMYHGMGNSMDLMNMESFLANVGDWLDLTYG